MKAAGLIKPAVFALALAPLASLAARAVRGGLGPDPAQALSVETGEWTLRFLLLALAMTPLRQLSGNVLFARHRRMLGLFAFFYACAHFLAWAAFLLGFRWSAIAEELAERPFVTAGFAAWLILAALAATSPRAAARRLGRNWKRLHRLVYLAAGLAMVHLVWILRSDFGEAALYGGLLAALLGYRLARRLSGPRRRPLPTGGATAPRRRD